MNRISVLFFSFAAIAASVAAQDKVTVPLSSPSQPATVKVHLINGSITVTPGNSGQVVVESDGAGIDFGRQRERDRNIPPGMHRIDTGSRGFNVEEDHNVVTVNPGLGGFSMNVTIQAPANTALDLKTVSGGHIEVTGITGDIDVEDINGPVTLKNVSGAVSAHTLSGKLTVSFDRLPPAKPMSFSSLNGTVDVTLPSDAKARLRLKTANGEIYSDFDVKMEPDNSKPLVEDARGRGGKYRIRVERGVFGSINGGGPEYSFQTMNGTILIHKK
ncbi:MAG TPA: DUF4097 family beta strand repeat-containing protein [Bryobacteraceae bacterium]|nr:DUF4097 family beta strand repeat-containing protein [Bryobacteraceae bacterium]